MSGATRWGACAIGLALLATAPAVPAFGQIEVGVRGSTLGAGLEVATRPTARIGVRAGVNSLSLTRDEEVEGIDYELKPRLRSFGVTLDLFPFGNVLYLAGGVLFNRNKATAEAIIGETITIGSRTYSNTEIQALRGELRWNRSAAPYAGLGFVTGGRVGIGFEAGVVFSGTPTIALSGTTTLTGAERQAFDDAVAQEEAEVRDWIEDHRRWTKYYPVLALGVRIRF